MAEIRFEERVAIVTGAGGGLGRSHALLLASRGAKVVVNDIGGAVDGTGDASAAAADRVVAEIVAAGGEAVASSDGVDTWEGGQRIVETALDAFGRVDVVINNAGILRDTSLHKMGQAEWDAVIAVHLTGTMSVTRAAWPYLREAQYGRIVNTTSCAGLLGNIGQANYGAAKMGIVGFTKTLAQEGHKKNIRANCIAPIAATRMTESILDAKQLEKLAPAVVSPVVAYLASEGCDDNGQVYAVGGGYVSRVALVEAKGVHLADVSPESVAGEWGAINDLSDATAFTSAMEEIGYALGQG